jgi:hypothetical protein|tara:strand:- start:491 stop:658 length:168 start_codon:yes stop_codon:yes gene_type:complete
MKNKVLKLSEKELNLLMDALYRRWGIGTLEHYPKSLARKLMDRLYDAKDEFIQNN